MMKTYLRTVCFVFTSIVLLQGCESTDPADPDGAVDSQVDASIEGVPMMADSFVLQTFALDAEGEPVNVDSVILVKDE